MKLSRLFPLLALLLACQPARRKYAQGGAYRVTVIGAKYHYCHAGVRR